MLKKIAIACGGLLISANVAIAGVNGLYAARVQGEPVVANIVEANGRVSGTIRFGYDTVALNAKSNGDNTFSGAWTHGGQQLPLSGRVNGNQLELTLDGETLVLSRQNGPATTTAPHASDRAVAPQPNYAAPRTAAPTAPATPVGHPAQRPAAPRQAAPTAPPVQVALQRGQYFTFALPAGWRHSESTNECFIYSPDGSLVAGAMGVERIQGNRNAAQFAQFAVELYGNKNVRILSARPVNIGQQAGVEVIEAEIACVRADGVPARGWVLSAVINAYGAHNGYAYIAGGEAGAFERNRHWLPEIAKQISVSGGSVAFQRDVALKVQQNTNLNRPMDHSFADGYWKQQKTYDSLSRDRSEATREVQHNRDSVTGEDIYSPYSTYDPTIGGYRNPNRPWENEPLQRAPLE